MKVIVSGSIAYDRIMDFPGRFEDHIIPTQIHKLNISFTVHQFHETFGGAAGNIVYNLSLLNEKPFLYASVGKDFKDYQKRLDNLNINYSGVKVYPQALTAAAYIITDKNDNQITGFFPGAMKFYSKKPKVGPNNLAIISPGNPNEMLDLADWYEQKNTPFIFDPGQQIIQFTKNQLRRVIKQSLIYIVNDYELALTFKITGYDHSLLLKSAGVLINTLGKKGSIIEIQQQEKLMRINIKGVKAKSVKDPTGAGDAYRAGILKGLTMNKGKIYQSQTLNLPWLKIGQLGSLAGVYAVEEYGTQKHFYTFEQFKERFQTIFKTKLE